MKSFALFLIAFGLGLTAENRISPVLGTDSVAEDADDPAIWVHPTDASKSLVIGTDKGGGLYVFNLDGKTVQSLTGLNHLNNVDVEYGYLLGGREVDLAVATERKSERLLVYSIDRTTGRLSDVTGSTKTFAGKAGEQAAPMGVALYKRPRDKAVFAFVSPKEGGRSGRIWQYRLIEKNGRVDLVKVREVGDSTDDEIEALAVDDELGYLYCSEEKVGIHKYYADPDKPATRLALFGKEGFMADREGIGIYDAGAGKGYIVVSDQGDGESEIHVYAREGGPAGPHDHAKLLAEIKDGADTTDGLDVTSRPLGKFKSGLLAVMNSKGKNFLFYDWEPVAKSIGK